MTFLFHKGCYSVRFAQTACDLLACQELRSRCFFGKEGVDQDGFDARCKHLMVADITGRVVATARLYQMQSGSEAHTSYAAQCYDLSGFSMIMVPMIEVGRFCISPDVLDADVVRVAWGALTQIVDAGNIGVLFGCTSFAGTDPTRYGHAFARLHTRHLGPRSLRPQPIRGEVIPLASVPKTGTDPLPSLLRTYLAMGGWVGDHAVVDHEMNTLHVFTCLAVASVPPKRAAALRALAENAPLT